MSKDYRGYEKLLEKIETATANTSHTWVAPDIPDENLNNAIQSFAAEAANERVLCIIGLQKNSKSGFLITDKALYRKFHERLATKNMRRIPLNELRSVTKTHKELTIEANGVLRWDMDTLIWESSGSKCAHAVVDTLSLLQDSEVPSGEASQSEVPQSQGEEIGEAGKKTVKIESTSPEEEATAVTKKVFSVIVGISAFLVFLAINGAPLLGGPAMMAWLADGNSPILLGAIALGIFSPKLVVR